MPAPPGVLRRLGAMVYDALLVLALLMLGTLPWVLVRGTGGSEDINYEPLGLGYQLYCVALVAAYFIAQWVFFGQTLGMKSWRLLVVRQAGQQGISWLGATLRFLTAPLAWLPAALGILWQYTDSQGLTWHDRLSGTRLVVTSKRRKTSYRTL
ncbi:MAG: RDD family protein [Pseudomonadota bacterium]